jgi:glycine/D-amino acid oxidase-like deaminating enzyme
MKSGRVLYDKSQYLDTPVPSYWEHTADERSKAFQSLQGEVSFDVAVIGGGYTGLSTAMHLARNHQVSVCVLESGHMGWGASGRNGGFGCFPASKLDLDQLISRYGLDETRRFYAAQLDGLQLIRDLCSEEEIDCDLVGDGNLEVAHKPDCMPGLVEYSAELRRHFGVRCRVLDAAEFRDSAFDSEEQFGGLHIGAGFGLHPLKLATGLAESAGRHGAVLYPHREVVTWARTGNRHLLTTSGGRVKATRVVVASNGYTQEGLHPTFDRRLLPAMSNIITTRPLTEEELAAHRWKTLNPVCNTRTLLFYFRLLPDNRLLFGARGDTTGTARDGEKMKNWMVRRLGEVFPHWRDVQISHYWRGLVCVTRKMTPSIGRDTDDPSVYYGFGYHANGVNTAPWAGQQIAEMIARGDDGADRVPVICRGLPRVFPLASLRLWYLRSAYQYYRFTDALL